MIENIEFEKSIKAKANTEINNFSININEVKYGIFFMFSGWSPSFVQLRSLINSLENFPDIILYIFDIDKEEFIGFKNRYMLYSDGWGETFWIKKGEIIGELKKYDSKSIKDLIRNNVTIVN